MAPELAVMLADPRPAPTAIPVAPTDATCALSEDQVADPVRSCVLPSLYVPVAVNCCVVPRGMDAFVGLTLIETSAAAPTVNVVEFEIEPSVALMFAVPVPALVANPPPEILSRL